MPSNRVPGVTVLIAARNEAQNIECCVESARPAGRILVVDSGSTDGTEALAAKAGADVIQFRYVGGYPRKRQWALENCGITTPWVFLLDADERLTGELWSEVAAVTRDEQKKAAFVVVKAFHFLGRRFRFGGFSHAAVLLLRHGRGVFESPMIDPPVGQDMEVHERIVVDGEIGSLCHPVLHEDYKGLTAYVDRHNHYSTWEARVRLEMLGGGTATAGGVKASLLGDVQARRRWLKAVAIRMPFEPLAWFAYHYVLRLGFLEGRRGWIAARLRANYIADVRAKMYEARLREEKERGRLGA